MEKKATKTEPSFLAAVRALAKPDRRLSMLTDEELELVNQGIAEVDGNISTPNLVRLIREHFGKDIGKTVLAEHLREWRQKHGKA